MLMADIFVFLREHGHGEIIIQEMYIQNCLSDGEWITDPECINLAEQGKVELEVCISHLGNKFLRSPPGSYFQTRLGDLM